MRISYSALEEFLNCPLKFKFSQIDKIKVPKSKEAVFGSIIHDVLKMLHEPSRLIFPTEEEMLQYFSQNWDPTIFADQEEEAIFFSQGVKMLKDYYAKNYPAKFNIVDLETRFEAPILDGSDLHLITGKIDRIDKLEDGLFEVIDYKTTKKMPAQDNVDHNLQLSVYYLGITNRWPSLLNEDRPVKLSLYYLKHGEKLSTFARPQYLVQIKEKILGIIDQIKKSASKEKFEPKPGPLCDWCSYQPYCPLFKHKFKEKTISDEQIKALIDEYFEIKSRSDEQTKRMAEIKDLINRYCDEHGLDRVFSEQGYITRLPQKRFTYDAKILREILEPLGKWNEILTVDANKLKKVIDSLPLEIKRKIEETKKLEREFKTITVSKNKQEISKNKQATSN